MLASLIIVSNVAMAKEPRLIKRHYRKAKIANEAKRLSLIDEVNVYLDLNEGLSVIEKRDNLPILRGCVASVVDICNDEFNRVDGWLMQPILEAEVDKRIAKLPALMPVGVE